MNPISEQEEFEFRLRAEQEASQDNVVQNPLNDVAGSQFNIAGPMASGATIPSGGSLDEARSLAADTGKAGLGLVEGFTGGIPRGIAEKVTGKDLSEFRGSGVGQFAGFMAGPGKLASSIGKGVAKKVVPEAFKTGGRFLEGRGVLPYGSRVASVLGKMTPTAAKAGAIEGGVAGAIGGALFPQEDDLAPEKRALAALAGGVIGAPIGAAVGGLGGFLKSKQLARSAKKVGEKLEKINVREPFKRVTAGSIFPVKNPNQFIDVEKGKLELANKEMTNLLAQEVDEAETVLKDLIPKWERANYDTYGAGLDDIAEGMRKSGKTIKVSELADELNTYLKKRNLIGEAPFRQPATSPTDRALVRWADELNKYRNSQTGTSPNASENLQDAVMGLDDVMVRMRSIKKTIPSKVTSGRTPMTPEYGGGREMDRILINLLDDGSNAKLAELKRNYAKFADLRDFARAKFDINSEYAQKSGQDLLQKFAKDSGRSTVDLTLDRGTVKKLEALEKEVGIPFLSKLRKYGSSFDALEENTRLLEEKAARTGVVTEAIAKRSQEAIRGIADKLKVPETLARQLATAAYAYLLSRSLGAVIKRND